jgi:ankyrin repeat protein
MELKDMPERPKVEDYVKEARCLLEAFRSGKPDAVRFVRRYHPGLPGRPDTNDRNPLTDAAVKKTRLSLAQAREILARAHQFESWKLFVKHIEALNSPHSQTAQFEAAVDAIIQGDLRSLKQLLKRNPALVQTRSNRIHHATLLHYVSANGVEDYHQKTPKNVVEITRVLLKAGAKVDADLQYTGSLRKRYPERMGSTTLGLAATSYHPAKAGVQLELLELLIKAGASVNGLRGGWNPLIAALHNGRGMAAEFLAKRGATLDLEGAAGTGRLAELKKFLGPDQQLKGGATRKQLESGFAWACEYGHTKIVQYLLECGYDPNTRAPHHGQTGLHWAGYGGHSDTVKVLLANGADVNSRDSSFQGTPLGWAIYGWANRPPEFMKNRYMQAMTKLRASGGEVKWTWLEQALSREQLQKLRAKKNLTRALGLSD